MCYCRPMSRPLRIEFPGAVYHVTARGNACNDIFLNDSDRQIFLTTLNWVVGRFGWICHAYCLMDNHFHLLIETPQANLSAGMRQLNGVYTQRFNRRHQRVGHLFQGRFKAIVVEKDSYLLELCRYIVLNPVRAHRVSAADQYPWSSYLATLSLTPPPAGLTVDWILAQFAKTRSVARKRYAAFVAEGIGKAPPWSALQGQTLLGSDAFIKQIAPHLQEKASGHEVPKRQHLLHHPTLQELFSAVKSKADRNHIMMEAHVDHGYTQAEIAVTLELHFSTVSRVIQATEDKMSKIKT